MCLSLSLLPVTVFIFEKIILEFPTMTVYEHKVLFNPGRGYKDKIVQSLLQLHREQGQMALSSLPEAPLCPPRAAPMLRVSQYDHR